jgi:hypothetical protein
MTKMPETPLETLARIQREAERAREMLLTPGCPPGVKGVTALQKIEIMARDRLTPDSEFSEAESGAA